MMGENFDGFVDKNFKAAERGELLRTVMLSILAVVLAVVSVYAGYLYFDGRGIGGFEPEVISGLGGLVHAYYDALKYCFALFCAGFTIFAPFTATAAIVFRSAAFGGQLCVFLSVARHSDERSTAFVSLVISAALLITLVVTAVSSVLHSMTLRYAAPDLRLLKSYPETRSYATAFTFVSAVVLLLVVLRYVVQCVLL